MRIVIAAVLLSGVLALAWAQQQPQGAAANAVGGGYIVFPSTLESDIGIVIFSHLVHVTQLGFSCNNCHPSLFPFRKSTAEQLNFMFRDIVAGRACGACHRLDDPVASPTTGRVAFPVDLAQLDTCGLCHAGMANTFQTRGPGPVTFDHNPHLIQAGYSCGSCHGGASALGYPRRFTETLTPSMPFPHAGAESVSCATCHDGATVSPNNVVAFDVVSDCFRCHQR
ncbi:MAG: hypothetical protein HY335_00080 [Deinococcus sp.]|nr:hypothetical protein [Deinococcus sp.]